jgi:hypothetical protein
MTYACPTWEFSADAHPLKLQHLQNKVLCTIGNFLRRTLVRDLQMAFNLRNVYDYITKLCSQQAEHVHSIDANLTLERPGHWSKYFKCSVRISARILAILTDHFCDFPHSLHANTRRVPWLGNAHSLPSPFEIMIYQSSYHLTLHSLYTDSVVK